MTALVPLPATGPVPGNDWELGDSRPEVEALLDHAFTANGDDHELGLTLAVVCVSRGKIVAERYGPDTNADTTLISWSMAKSVTQALVGLLAGDGQLDVDAPAPVPEWTDPDDPRNAITLAHLLRMRSGLEWNEDYVDADTSHCLEMLFGSGHTDMGAFAAASAAIAPADTVFNYSSGTTNIISRLITQLLGTEQAVRDYMDARLLGPLAMASADPRFDDAGTFVGSSYLYATARDFARFGMLYLRDGIWNGRRLLPEGWVDRARTPTSVDAEVPGRAYGEHWWMNLDDPAGTFWANGYEGQFIAVVPSADAVVVRLGKTPADKYDALRDWQFRLVDAMATTSARA